MKNIIIGIVVIVIIGLGVYFFNKSFSSNSNLTPASPEATPNTEPVTPPVSQENGRALVIGKSVQGRDITAYQYGTGTAEVLFIGGIHGGYEWNTVLVANSAMDYLKANPSVVPSNVKVTIIPVLNPDGLSKTLGIVSTTTPVARFTLADVPTDEAKRIAGRFNANTVDLNRNFDCDWQSVGKWQNKDVSGGSRAFSEPESMAIKNYVEQNKPTAVVTWYSAAGGVFASSCHNGVSDETQKITKTFADASGYPAFQNFNFYEITGDMVNWFAKENIPAISVLLTNHTDTEWTKNQKGIDALLKYYAE